ncbi:MAG: hypothetical protein O7H39_11855 [Gammaproteobacteria bacterium]|nr:hypothetical protein [Gammaproteobacteria bacterium]
MIWVVDKKVVRHIVEADGKLLEIPVRVKFEYAIDDGALVADTFKVETLFNSSFVHTRLPTIDMDNLANEVEETARREVLEDLAFRGYTQAKAQVKADNHQENSSDPPEPGRN